MKTGTILAKGSGLTASDCHFLGGRWDARYGFQQGFQDSWVVQMRGGKMSLVHGVAGFLNGLWASGSGAVYVSDIDRGVYTNPSAFDSPSAWKLHPLNATLDGVWGLDERFVLTWGGVRKPRMFRWNGQRWDEIPSPGKVTAVHGLAPDLIYAVGYEGLIARWDGGRWHRVRSPTRATLSAVFVASPDELYAVGAGGVVLEGSSHGWSAVVGSEERMFGVAKYDGKVWVGAADGGLMQLSGNKLVLIAKKIFAERLEARGNCLLVSTPDFIGDTRDGKTLDTIADVRDFNTLIDARKPLWTK